MQDIDYLSIINFFSKPILGLGYYESNSLEECLYQIETIRHARNGSLFYFPNSLQLQVNPQKYISFEPKKLFELAKQDDFGIAEIYKLFENPNYEYNQGILRSDKNSVECLDVKIRSAFVNDFIIPTMVDVNNPSVKMIKTIHDVFLLYRIKDKQPILIGNVNYSGYSNTPKSFIEDMQMSLSGSHSTS